MRKRTSPRGRQVTAVIGAVTYDVNQDTAVAQTYSFTFTSDGAPTWVDA
jgi:hypothetical protein